MGAPTAKAPPVVEGNVGEKTKEVIEDEAKYLVGTYARAPVVLERGKGCKVYDVEGKEYLDLSGGIAVNALGHGDDDWLKAVVEQAATLTHVSNVYYSIPQVWAMHANTMNLFFIYLFLTFNYKKVFSFFFYNKSV